jgi:hypothetical protein
VVERVTRNDEVQSSTLCGGNFYLFFHLSYFYLRSSTGNLFSLVYESERDLNAIQLLFAEGSVVADDNKRSYVYALDRTTQ